jgi:glycosyltransferase involved in cell wall biosynthesis
MSAQGVRRTFAQARIFASSALYEPFGLTVLEAAQARCALVLSDIPTFRELWDGAALFAPARDARAFAEADPEACWTIQTGPSIWRGRLPNAPGATASRPWSVG